MVAQQATVNPLPGRAYAPGGSADTKFRAQIRQVSANPSTNITSKKMIPSDLKASLNARAIENAKSSSVGEQNMASPPPLNICVLVVGSRGDVQPFIALGKELSKDGHRVRIGTHETFRQFVGEAGLEFYPIGGDPAELMAYMVKNPGLVPGVEAIKSGDIKKKRKTIKTILNGCWAACTMPTDDSKAMPFTADAIISNPVTFAHIHCAEKLNCPLHVYFTMPWSKTKEYPHPLANADYSKHQDRSVANEMTYHMVETLTWQGLADVINDFRKNRLGLSVIPMKHVSVGPTLLAALKIPHTYMWSPSLVPKPADWGDHIDVTGFQFLDLASNYTPDEDLARFLAAGPAPVYIGFGSIVVDDPDSLTKMILDAVSQTGVRALISKGWGGLNADNVPDNVFFVGNCPHDWLFERVSAVVHHGGAGTTAAGIRAGKPTAIVPFFGDQPFWGQMVHTQGAGPEPVPYKKLNAKKLAEMLRYCQNPEVISAAQSVGEKMRQENGVRESVLSFYKHLDTEAFKCDVDPTSKACLYLPSKKLKLSLQTVETLVARGTMKEKHLKALRPWRYATYDIDTIITSGNIGSGATRAMACGVDNVCRAVYNFGSAPTKAVIHSRKMSNSNEKSKTIAAGFGKGLGGLLYYPVNGLFGMVGELGDGLWNTPEAGFGKKHCTPKQRNAAIGMGNGLLMLGYGVGSGVYDFFSLPVRRARQAESTSLGALAGIAQGTLSLVCKPVAGIAYLAYCPYDGIKNSVRNAGVPVHTVYYPKKRLTTVKTVTYLPSH